MKFRNALLTIFVGLGVWNLSGLIVEARLKDLSKRDIIPYGPLPVYDRSFYSFDNVSKSFDKTVPLKRISELDKVEFEETLLSSLDSVNQKRFRNYIKPTLEIAQSYQIDPLWVISIMMVESNFNFKALSHVNARGLMQVKPDTAHEIYQVMKKNHSLEEVGERLYVANENIEIGTFYLKKLLHNFRMDYNKATSAYNLGPNGLRSRLKRNEIDLVSFNYLNKVQNRYNMLASNLKKVIKKKSKPYTSTYAYSEQGLEYTEKFVNLFFDKTSETLSSNNSLSNLF